ncbi:MAG: 16S rRNA (uracil(1498)-N(3))-methyltransferase [Gemmatimonadaceae bacterium]
MVERGRDWGARVITLFAPEAPAAGTTMTLGEDAAHHAHVRRVDAGARVRLVDGQGTVGHGLIVRMARRSVIADVESVESIDAPPPVHLLVPVADKERMLWLAEKAVELGASSWRPVMWRRSKSVSPRGEGPVFQAKLRARMQAALEQSGGAWLPAPFPDATVERACAAAPPGQKLVLDPGGDPILGDDMEAPVSLCIGPEGGIAEDEMAQLSDAGWKRAALGGSVLRFETAAIAALAVARAALARSGATRDG